MKYQVLLDFGVSIAGKTFPHGSIIDSETMTPKVPDSAVASLLEADRAAELQKRQDAIAKQAQDDFAAAEKSGFIEPAIDAPEQPKKVKKGQEG